MKLKDLDLSQLTPDFMKDDACIKALTATIEPLVHELAGKMRPLSIWADMEELTEGELDQLAVEMDIPWYNNIYDRTKKIKLLKEADKMIKKMGTPAALQYVIDEIFGNCTLEESGIDYEGEPHRFTVTVNSGVNLNQTTYGRFVYLLNKVKRASSWIDSVGSVYSAEARNYIAAFIRERIEDKLKSDNLDRLQWPSVTTGTAAGLREVTIERLHTKEA